jgi:hypothetical protein
MHEIEKELWVEEGKENMLNFELHKKNLLWKLIFN